MKMGHQRLNNLDERPRWHVVEELRRGNLRSLRWKLQRHGRALDETNALRQAVPPNIRVDDGVVRDLQMELAASIELHEALTTPAANEWARSALPTRKDPAAILDHLLHGPNRGREVFLYLWIRLARPSIVVETGCFTGWDSLLILSALNRNALGHLYTIDLPAREGAFSQVGTGSGLPNGFEPGFLVPKPLRRRWSLILGDARSELQPLLERVGQVDLFFHDSHHSYTHMMWEYTSIWPFLSGNGIVVSDDISWNTAFLDFAGGVGSRPLILRENSNIGAVVRRKQV